ncbi:hypothetical protein GGI35DRAFT_491983 [Trichoderma velutinum]
MLEPVSASALMFGCVTEELDSDPKQTLIIDTKIRNPLEMAQHQKSTFRILVAIMRRHHESVFNGELNTVTDHDFWSNLFIVGLDSFWMVGDTHVWRDRFGWVLQYIRTGTLPEDAAIARGILQLAMTNLLAEEKHPYNYDTSIPTFGFLNPDLNPLWIRQLLSASNDSIRVEKRARSRLKGFDISKFCKHFGILIASLWEEALYSNIDSHRKRNAVAGGTTNFLEPSPMPEPDQLETRSSSSITSATCPIDHLESIELRQPQSPPPYGQLTTQRNHNWHKYEDDYLKYLMECDMTWSQRHEKFKTRFGDARWELSHRQRRRKLEKHCPRFLQRKVEHQWSIEEHEYLLSLHQAGVDHSQWVESMRDALGVERTLTTLLTRVREFGLDNVTPRPWTVVEQKFLDNFIDNVPKAEICDLFWETFGSTRSEAEILRRYLKIKGDLELSTHTREYHWTPEEDNLVRNWKGKFLDLMAAYEKQFGPRRTKNAMRKRLALMRHTGLDTSNS